MGPVGRLRAALDLASSYPDHWPAFPGVMWGDLRAILSMLDAVGHIVASGHCPSCDGHSCPDVD